MRLIILLIVSMLMNIFPIPSYSNVAQAAEKDYEAHWAKTEITKWIKSELIKGYPDGNFKPDSPIKRVEFFALVNRAFGLDEKENVKFKDLSTSFWGYETIQAAVKYGVTRGYEDETVRPNEAITRQEVAVILQRILGLSASQTQNTYIDAPWMPTWSERSIMAVTDSKIMNGYLDGTFGLETKMTRAETVVTLERALKKNVFAFSKAGTYGDEKNVQLIKRDLIISVAGVTLQNVTISGSLTLGAGIGEGDVFLKNVIISGTTIVQGGGSKSIHLDNVTASRIIVDKPGDEPVRLVSSGTTNVSQVEVRSAVKLEEQDAVGKGFQAVTVSKELPDTAKVELAGNFEEVTVQASAAKIEVQSGKVATVNVPEGAKEVTFSIGANATVEKLVSDAVVKVEGKGKLETAELGERAKESKFVLKPAEVTGAAAETVKAAIKKQEEDEEKVAVGAGGGGAGGGGFFGGGGGGGIIVPPIDNPIGVEITGTVSLPNGELAGPNGVTVMIIASGKPSSHNQTVTIPASQNQTTYAIKSVSTGSYMISYQYSGNDYVTQGFYDGYKVTGYDYNNAKVDVLTKTTVNLELIKGIELRGVVSLPNNEVASASDEVVTLVAHNTSQVLLNKVVIIPKGSNSASYTTRIATGSFLLGYSYNSSEYVKTAYLAKDGSMNPNLHNSANHQVLELTSDYQVNVTLVKGIKIYGTVALANGEVAGASRETINVIVQNHNAGYQYGYSVDINPGSNSATYVGSVPEGNYVVGYSYLGTNYVNRAFYNSAGMMAMYSYSTLVNVASPTRVDLNTVKGNKIKGTLELPNGEVAGTNGVVANIVVSGNDIWSSDFVTIPAGSNKISFETTKRFATGSYVISVNYYGSEYTPVSYLSFELLDFSNEIQLQLLKGVKLSFEVSLPDGELAGPGGVILNVFADSYSAGVSGFNRSAFIPEGSSSARFEKTVSTGTYIIGMRYSGNKYIEMSYFKNGKSVPYLLDSNNNAPRMLVNSDLNINLKLLKGVQVQTKVQLPNGEVAPMGGINYVDVFFDRNYYITAFIPAGQNSTIVSKRIPTGSYLIIYSYNRSPDYLQQGYYSAGSMETGSNNVTKELITSDKSITVELIKGISISGTISLPNGELAPVGGTLVTVQLSPEFGRGYEKTYTIPAGSNSISYSFPRYLAKGKYWISYSAKGGNYIEYNYYNAGRQINVITDTTIDFVLIKGVRVTTTVQLPSGAVAGVNGEYVQVDFSNNNQNSVSAFIPKGKNSVVVSKVLQTGSYLISYYYHSGQNYVYNGYYSAGIMKITGSNSDRETIISDKSITIELIKGLSVNGTISLPNGEVAPSGGLKVILELRGSQYQSKTVAIPAGQNSVAYSFAGNITPGNYWISYSYSGNNYVQRGYYNAGSMVLSTNGISQTSITTASTINLTLIKGVQVSGAISLPNGEVAPSGGVSVGINIYTNDVSYSKSLVIPAGQNSISYAMNVPTGSYYVRYNYDGNSYVQHGFNKNGQTVSESNLTTINADATLNLSLIKGVLVYTKVQLPNGEVAGSNGAPVSVYYNGSSTHYVYAFIPAGQNSATVTKRISTDSFLISYYYHSGQDYVQYGYYNAGNMVTNDSGYRENITSDKSITIELIKGLSVSGTISLPNGEVAPSGGLKVILEISGPQYQSKTVTIPAGQNSVAYSFAGNITPGNYWISYSYSGSNYVQRGYYNAGAMVLSQTGISQTSITTASTINLTLIKGVQVSGAISLPNGEVAPSGGITIALNIYNNNGVSNYKSLVIPAGQSSIIYSMNVPSGSYYVRYNYGGYSYVEEGFNKNGQTVPESNLTTINADASINLSLIKGVVVQTKVQLPNGEVAGSNGVGVVVYYNGSSTQYVKPNIPSGQNSVIVSKRIPTGSYLISYYYHSGQDYVKNGYYNAGTMSLNNSTNRETITMDKSITVELIKGLSVSGTISLPNGEVAPSGGVQVTVNLEWNQSKTVTIPAGQNSVVYSFAGNITPGYYWISYSYSGSNYVQRGYYNAGTMVLSTNGISQTSITTASTINLTLIKGVQVSGVISLPNGELAPNGGVSVTLNIYNNGVSYGKSLVILAGQTSCSYSMNVPTGSYYVSYNYSGNSYVQQGFYKNGQTLPSSNLTTINADATINLSLIKGVVVQTKIQLPNGEVAGSNGEYVSIRFSGSNFKNYYFDVNIPAGLNNVFLSKRIPTGSYLVNYHVYNNKYISNMYYSAEAMVSSINASAEPFVSDSNITIQLVRNGYYLNGQIVLPNGELAPNGGLVVKAVLKNGNQQWEYQVTIPQGSGSTAYSFQVPSGSYILGYSIVTASSSYLSAGYVDGSGMTPTLPTSNNLPVNRDLTTPITLIRKP